MTETRPAVLVTGAAAGIGAATVDRLLDGGFTVFAGRYRTPLGRTDPHLHELALDVTDPEAVAGAAATVAGQVEGLRAVVNNAGLIVQGPLELVPADELGLQFAVNTVGPALVTQAFLPLLRAGGGRVVNISAPTARLPVPFLGPIGASKAALGSLSDALRAELRPWGIPVSVVEPGATATEIFDKAAEAAGLAAAEAGPERAALYSEQLRAVAAAAARTPLGPVDKVAAVVVRAVEARRPRRRYLAARDARLFALLAHLPGPLRDAVVARAFGLHKVRVPAAVPALHPTS